MGRISDDLNSMLTRGEGRLWPEIGRRVHARWKAVIFLYEYWSQKSRLLVPAFSASPWLYLYVHQHIYWEFDIHISSVKRPTWSYSKLACLHGICGQ